MKHLSKIIRNFRYRTTGPELCQTLDFCWVFHIRSCFIYYYGTSTLVVMHFDLLSSMQFQKAYPEIYASRAVMSGVTRPAITHTALGKRSSMPNLLAPDASSADLESAPPTSTTTIAAAVPSSPRSSSSCSSFSGGKMGKGKGGKGKGRTLSKLATNYYSTDCLAASKPVLR